jgi:SAM-dependent methyltransferase
MKLFQYIYYFFRSIFYRGFANTIKLLSYEKKYEKLLGINTLSIENLDQLTLASQNSKENHHYQGASYFVLFSILNSIPESFRKKAFIDYGCGKGRALFVAEQCGFEHLIGVDIAKELIDVANQNLLIYQKKSKGSSINFVFEDATRYEIPKDACVFYFFNPFGPQILYPVLQNIKESIKKHPREIYCIYLNPIYQEVFIQSEFKLVREVKTKRYLEAVIYSL